ncbi:MAG: hypothetical protein ACC661_01645 [Verrucomicrobiales bacterium]
MKKRFGDYRRLARGSFGCSSLWAGPDHLVYVRGTGFLLPLVEEYKRFRYEDVRAITMTGSSFAFWMLILSAAAAVSSAAGIFLPDYEELAGQVVVSIFLGPILFAGLFILVWNLVRGSSCRCCIETSVGQVRIRPVSRLRVFERVLAELEPLLLEHQQAVASIQPPELPGGQRREGAVAGTRAAVQGAPAGAARVVGRGSPFLVPTLLAMLSFGAAWLMYAHRLDTGWLIAAGVLNLLLFGGVVVAIVQLLRGYTPGVVLVVLWTSLVQQLVVMMAWFALYMVWSIKIAMHAEGVGTAAFNELFGHPVVQAGSYYFSLGNGILSLVLGISGLAGIRSHFLRRRPPAAPPALPGSADSEGGRSEGGGAREAPRVSKRR